MASSKQKTQININKEDPEKLYELVELVGTGSYGEVFKVRAVIFDLCATLDRR